MGIKASHPLAMASGIMPEATPCELIYTAAKAGFDFGGMWVEIDDWTDQTTTRVKRALQETNLKLLDIEVIWIKPGEFDENHLRILDIGGDLSVQNALVVSSDPDRSSTVDKLSKIIEHGSHNNIKVNLEFGLFTEVKTLSQAASILHEINAPSSGLLIDSLHFERSGGQLEDIASLPPEWLSYVQLCDAPKRELNSQNAEEILTEAIDGRLHLGHGALPLHSLMKQLPSNIPIAIELRSKQLRDHYPDLYERAKVVENISRQYCEKL